MKFGRKIEELNKKRLEIIKELGRTEGEIRRYRENCKHNIIKAGFSDCPTAVCKKCGKKFGWWCPKSKDGVCEYPENDEWCIHCGDPDERK